MMEQVTSDYFQFLENVTLVMQKKKKQLEVDVQVWNMI